MKMNEQLIIDIENRIREVDSIDELFNKVDTKIFEEEDY